MRRTRALQSLAIFGFAAVMAQTAALAATLTLTQVQTAAGLNCPDAEGVYVALLVPQTGVALLATRPFPGGRRVGLLEGADLSFDLPGLPSQEMRVVQSSSGSTPIWGLMDRTLEIGSRSGCFSFGDRTFSSEDDLKTYLHWVLRDVFFRLRGPQEVEPLALRLADRTVTLEIAAAGHRPIELSTPEGGIAGVRLPDSDGVYYFQPLVLDQASGRVAVKVLVKEGPFFGEGAAREIAFVVAGFDTPGVTSSDPVLEIRCLGIE